MSDEDRQGLLRGIERDISNTKIEILRKRDEKLKLDIKNEELANRIKEEQKHHIERMQEWEEKLRVLQEHVISGDFSQEAAVYESTKRTM